MSIPIQQRARNRKHPHTSPQIVVSREKFFNFSEPPRCRLCPYSTQKHFVEDSDPNEWNRGRPYYKCFNEQYCTWTCWDDGIGMHIDNPSCYCGLPSRQDKHGAGSDLAEKGFWTCAKAQCRYRSDDRSGEPGSWLEDPNIELFDPWLGALCSEPIKHNADFYTLWMGKASLRIHNRQRNTQVKKGGEKVVPVDNNEGECALGVKMEQGV